MNTLQTMDVALLYRVQGWHTDFLDSCMALVSDPLFLWLFIGSIFLLACFWPYWKGSAKNSPAVSPGWAMRLRRILAGLILLFLSMGITEGMTQATKGYFGRLRPYQALSGIRHVDTGQWVTTPDDMAPRVKKGNSFISGHASITMAAVTSIATQLPQVSPFIYGAPLLVGVSRIYLGRHYPSDVLAGWIVGWGVAFVVTRKGRNIIYRLLGAEK